MKHDITHTPSAVTISDAHFEEGLRITLHGKEIPTRFWERFKFAIGVIFGRIPRAFSNNISITGCVFITKTEAGLDITSEE